MFTQWFKFTSDVLLAQFEAQRVISLRLGKLARGGAEAEAEAHRMVAEKLTAAAEASVGLASGQSPRSVVRRYRTIMRANARRLAGK